MARISTRKALALRKELEALLKAPALPLKVGLSAYVAQNRESPAAAVTEGGTALLAAVRRHNRLSGILRALRVAVARANVEADVEGILAGLADVERQSAAWKAVLQAPLALSDEEVKGKVNQAWRTLQGQESYGTRESVDVPVATQQVRDLAAEAVAELRRVREAYEDQRTAANAAPRIEIAEEDAQFLRELGLL